MVSESPSVVPVELGLLDGRNENHDEFDCVLGVSHGVDIVCLKLYGACVVELCGLCVAELGSHTSCAMYDCGMTARRVVVVTHNSKISRYAAQLEE